MSNESERVVTEAEKVLAEVYPEVRAEVCPQGDQCPVHFRVDDEYFDHPTQYARLITYVGDYAVVTEDNNQISQPALILKALIGALRREDLPPRWETVVMHVGSGVIADLTDKTAEEQRQAFRHSETHDEWDKISYVHKLTVGLLQRGELDVSKPLEG